MDITFAKKLLDIQIENGRRILDAYFGVDHAEAIFFDIIRLLNETPLLKPYLLQRIEDTFDERDADALKEGMVPNELISLIAHEFRWPEIALLAEKRIDKFYRGDASFAVSDIARRIHDAYKDDWEDREFYRHYAQQG